MQFVNSTAQLGILHPKAKKAPTLITGYYYHTFSTINDVWEMRCSHKFQVMSLIAIFL